MKHCFRAGVGRCSRWYFRLCRLFWAEQLHHTALLHLMYCLKHVENMHYGASKAKFDSSVGKLPLTHHSLTSGQLCHIPYQMEQKVEQ